jgi:DivIVA domain-containing protein
MTHTPGPTFTVVRIREAYVIEEVNAFLDQVERELQGPLPNKDLARRVRTARFAPTRLKPGYDMGEVDQHLDELERRAEARYEAPTHVSPAGAQVAPARRLGESHKPQNSFKTSRFVATYSIEDVDAFLAQIDRALAGRLPDESLAQYILEARFTPNPGMRRGYDMQEVDQHLDMLREWALTGRRPS